MRTSDTALLENWVAHRDPEAMAAIIARHAGMVYATCRRIVGNETEAEDAAQECFIRLASVRNAGSSLPGLLHTMATRQALNHLRSESRRRARERVFAQNANASSEVTWDDLRTYVDEAIDELPEQLRAVVVRHFLEGETHASVARDLGMTRAGVSHRIHVAIRQIRKALEGRGIPVATSGLAAMLVANAAEAAPSGVVAALGKLAIAGAKSSSVTHAGAAATTGGGTVLGGITMLKVIGVLAIVAGTAALGLWVPRETPPAVPEPQTRLAAAAAEARTEPPENVLQLAKAEDEKPDAGTAVEAVVEPARTVRGIVKSDTGYPRPGVYISPVIHPYTIWRSTKSNADGTFTLDVAPDQTQWIAYSQNTQKADLFTIPEKPAVSPIEVVLDLNLTEVSGRVVGPDEKGVIKANVELRIMRPDGQEFIAGKFAAARYGYYSAMLIPTGDGFTIQARVVPPGEESPGPWTAPQAMSARLHYLEIPDLVVSAATAKNIVRNQPIKGWQSSFMTAEPKERFGGYVRDPEGQPIPDVRIGLTYPSQSGGHYAAVAGTDEQGRWSRLLPANLTSVTVRVQHSEYVGSVLAQDRQQPSLPRMRDGTSVIVMEPGIRVAGTVRDTGGRAVPDVLILTHQLYSHTPGGSEATANAPIEDSTSTRTDADGTFSVSCLPPGERDLQILKPGYGPKVASLDVVPNMPPLDITLDHGGVIRGRIIDEEGDPIEGAYVYGNEWKTERQFDLNARALADEEGRFTLENVPLEGTLRFGFGVKRKDGRRDRTYLSMHTSMMVPREEPYEITMYRPVVFEGTVIDDETESPVTEFVVKNGLMLEGGDRVDWIHTSSPSRIRSREGKFRKKLDGVIVDHPPTAPFVVGILAEGYFPATSPVVRLGEKVEPFVIRLRRGEPRTGIITDADGQPVDGAKVAWIEPGRRAFVQRGQFENRFVDASDEIATTNTEGRFELPPSDAPAVLLALHEKGYVFCNAADHVRDGELELIPWARVEGAIYSGEGPEQDARIVMKPVEAADEFLELPIHWFFTETSHTDGRFEFDHVPAIPLTVGRMVVSGRFGDLSHNVYLTPEPGKTHVVQVGGGGRTVVGKIDFADASLWSELEYEHLHAVARNALAEQSEGAFAPIYVALFAEDGSFSVESLPPGEYELTIDAHETPGEMCGAGPILASATARFKVPDDTRSNPLVIPTVTLQAPPPPDLDELR